MISWRIFKASDSPVKKGGQMKRRLFKPERLSVFACSDLTNEKIYLLWLDFEDEPELWAYDSNGESRYKDLREYLEAYLADDISAMERRWRL
jgi:hypothetical protein